MTQLPPEDQPDAIWIDHVGSIPVHYDDDPRFEVEKAARSEGIRQAQAMHTADDLLAGMVADDWHVRIEVIDRLIARAKEDDRTVPVLLQALRADAVPDVRLGVALGLAWFEGDVRVVAGLREALSDPDEDVRDCARQSLIQVGEDPDSKDV